MVLEYEVKKIMKSNPGRCSTVVIFRLIKLHKNIGRTRYLTLPYTSKPNVMD